jgi:hypothetical protein
MTGGALVSVTVNDWVRTQAALGQKANWAAKVRGAKRTRRLVQGAAPDFEPWAENRKKGGRRKRRGFVFFKETQTIEFKYNIEFKQLK